MNAPAPRVSLASPSAIFKYRLSLGVFVSGLVFSGLTAFPLLWELRALSELLGIDPSGFREETGIRYWIAYVHFGLEETYSKFPFVGYGTDWLAFGHLVIAGFFIKPLLEPFRHDWVLRVGLVACAAVIPLAVVAGEVRGIPAYWRILDCMFGVAGAIPLCYCLKLTPRPESLDPAKK
jgi:hypothetical protein